MARLPTTIVLGVCMLLAILQPVSASGPSPYAAGWTAHRIDSGTVPIGIIRVGAELFGIGREPVQAPAGAARTLMWRSTNGTTWTPVPLSSRVFPPGSGITRIVRIGSRYVAVGGTTYVGRGQSRRAMVWLSSNGRDWSRVHDQAAFHGTTMTAAAASANTIVAVGSISANGQGPISSESGTVWSSGNGVTWQRVESKTFAGANIADVIRAGPRFVAVGDSYPAPPPYGSHAVVWISADGSAWSRVPRLASVFVDGSAMSRVVSGAAGLVAFGITEPPNPDYRSFLWTSRNGLSWHLVAGDPLKHGFVNGMTSVGKNYFAVGSADGDPVLWTSLDGAHLQQVAGDAVFSGANTQLFGITTSGGHLVVFGAQAARPSSRRIPTIWIWTAGSMAGPNPSPPANLDARAFRLRFTDLPAGHSSGLDSWLYICDLEDRPDPGGQCHHMLGLLGHYSAYFTEFDRLDSQGEISGTTIIVASSTGAQKVLQDPNVVIQPLGAPPEERVASSVRIGQEFRLYRVRVLNRQGESPYWDGVAGIWRDGRDIGIVEVTGTGKAADDLVVKLARAMHARL